MEAITVEEAKLYMRIDLGYTMEDGLILSLIKTARIWCEKYTGLSFIPKQLEVFSDSGYLDLPCGPVKSIISIKDCSGNDIQYMKKGLQHPRIISRQDMYIVFNAGYDDLPEELKTGVKMLTATLYENRESSVIGERSQSVLKTEFDVKVLLQPFSRSGGLFL